jgi:hypothetical protein
VKRYPTRLIDVSIGHYRSMVELGEDTTKCRTGGAGDCSSWMRRTNS